MTARNEMLKVSVHPPSQTQVYGILLCTEHLLNSKRDGGDSDCVIRKRYERMYGWIMDAYFIRTFVLELLFRFEDQDEEQ